MAKGFWKASRWVEISVALIVLGILMYLTLPYFSKFKCRAMQSEARVELMNLYSAQKLYKAQHGTYATLETLRSLGLVSLREKYYVFATAHANEKSFEISAISKDHDIAKGDQWSIDQKGQLNNLKNACETGNH